MSLILWHDEDQRIIAEKSRETQQKELKNEKITTEIKKFTQFYPAEE